jgi:NAD(P)-dependent dehydrogenase (short-subunit alcohol dehydrogenase family)
VSGVRNVAVVTGGSAGVGAEICRHMLDAGYEVISLAHGRPDWSHERFSAHEVELLDPEAVREIASKLAERHNITHLVHNAGAIRPASLPETTTEDLQALTQLHVGAALILAQAFLPGMEAARFGRIILISSRGALGLANRTAYGATKAGMIGLARSWALELAPSGITVNVAAPGPIGETEMFRGVIPKGDPREQSLAAAIPMKRLGRVDDVARTVMFFADRDNDFVTGQTLYVCGGASLGSLPI